VAEQILSPQVQVDRVEA
jgi:hypothetical protein